MPKKSRFTLGEEVVVSAVCKIYALPTSGYNSYRRAAKSVAVAPVRGFIAGARRRMLGVITYGMGDDMQSTFKAHGSVLVWLVATSMTNKPIEVLDADVQKNPSFAWPPRVPWSNRPAVWQTKEYKAEMRYFASMMKRGKDGRFVKS